MRLQRLIAVVAEDRGQPSPSNVRPQAIAFDYLALEEDRAIVRSQHFERQQRGAGVEASASARRRIEIYARRGDVALDRRRAGRVLQQAPDAVRSLGAALRLAAVQIVEAAARMRVEEKERRR